MRYDVTAIGLSGRMRFGKNMAMEAASAKADALVLGGFQSVKIVDHDPKRPPDKASLRF